MYSLYTWQEGPLPWPSTLEARFRPSPVYASLLLMKNRWGRGNKLFKSPCIPSRPFSGHLHPEVPAQITLRLIPEPEQVSSLDLLSGGQIRPLVCAPLGLTVGKKSEVCRRYGWDLLCKLGVCPREYEKEYGMGQGLGAHASYTTTSWHGTLRNKIILN